MTASPAAAFFVEQNSTRQGGAARVTTASPEECTLPLHSPLARCSIICSEKKANLKKNGTALAVPTLDLGVCYFGGKGLPWALRVKRGCEGSAAVPRGVQAALALPGHPASESLAPSAKRMAPGRIFDREARCRADRAKPGPLAAM